VALPYYSWHHAVVVPRGHALESTQKLTLEALAEYPLITYNEGFTGRGKIDAAFAAAGLAPDIVMSALDADVIKSYVELGLGVGIIASMAFEPERDTGLRLLDATGLFPLTTSRIAVRQGRYLRGYAYRFLELCSPELTEAHIRSSVTPKSEPEVS
jgi:LysR family cys regulon transcriptional activator